MADCPQCRSTIEIPESGFGTLFNCPNCQAVFFVGWDGVPEQPQSPPAEAVPLDFGPGVGAAPEVEMTQPAATDWEPPALDSSTDFKDVVEFGNSPEMKSPITYTVSVQGIEIADIRQKFKEAITDSRFGWDVDQILKQLQGGNITFTDLSPAKASALINRIKYLPIRISWRQNVLS